MYELTPTKIVQRSRKGGLVAAGYVYDRENDVESDVVIQFDYTPSQSAQPNPDRANPGPGSDAEVDVTQVNYDSDQNQQIDVAQCRYDPVDFMNLADEFTQEQTQHDVSWARRVAGI
jgi:hypothetical protein